MGILGIDLRQAARRLFTHEDAAYGHAHKIFGVAVLASFAYRAWRWWRSSDGSMGFSSEIPLMVLLHATLHLTSFQFNIGPRRNLKYNVIWPEMRWHTTIFASRSLVAMLALHLEHLHPFWAYYVRPYVRPAIVLGTMALADTVTRRYKGHSKTMRDNPFPEGTPGWAVRAINFYYSISQAGATAIVLFSRRVDAVFWVLLPIQTAPFLMTLVKKGVIDRSGWHLWYSLALASNFALSLATPGRMSDLTWPEMVALLATFAVWRIGLDGNKYAFWVVVSGISASRACI